MLTGPGPKWLLALVFLFQTTAYADVIVSKTGQSLEGVITRENGDEVALDVDGMELTLKRAEIRTIRRGPAPKKKQLPAKVLEAAVESGAALPAGTAPEAPAGNAPVDISKLERPVIVFDQRDWKLDYQDVRNNQVIAEFVLPGQSVKDWTELVTAQLFVGLRTEPRYFVKYVKEKTAKTCAGTKWQVVRETPYDITYEWSVKNCSNVPDQSEIARVVLGADGLHVLHYAIKMGEMPADNREKWIGCLEASQIVKPQA